MDKRWVWSLLGAAGALGTLSVVCFISCAPEPGGHVDKDGQRTERGVQSVTERTEPSVAPAASSHAGIAADPTWTDPRDLAARDAAEGDRRANLDALFASEPDGTGSSERVAALRKRLSTLAEKPWYRNVGITIGCKSTMCRIDCDYGSVEDEEELSSSLIGPTSLVKAGTVRGEYVRMGAGKRGTLYIWYAGGPPIPAAPEK
jgi:hypothetical protein